MLLVGSAFRFGGLRVEGWCSSRVRHADVCRHVPGSPKPLTLNSCLKFRTRLRVLLGPTLSYLGFGVVGFGVFVFRG